MVASAALLREKVAVARPSEVETSKEQTRNIGTQQNTENSQNTSIATQGSENEDREQNQLFNHQECLKGML